MCDVLYRHGEGGEVVQDAKGAHAKEPRLARLCGPRPEMNLHVGCWAVVALCPAKRETCVAAHG